MKKPRTPTYISWQNMKNRCNNPNFKYYSYYGGRGITVCKDWHTFSNFLRDMGERPKGKTLDRVDSNGNYEPSNCRWASHRTQQENRAGAHLLTYNGKTQCLTAWARDLGMKRQSLLNRFQAGWTEAEALGTPKGFSRVT